MVMTIYTVIFIAIVVIVSANIVKNHGKDCVSVDVFVVIPTQMWASATL